MILANELRLGNWISFDGKYCSVKEIRKTEIVITPKNTQQELLIKLDIAEPIELERDLLLALGFEEIPPASLFHYTNFRKAMAKNEVLEALMFHDSIYYRICYSVNDNFTSVKTEGLHQLQNLFYSLTGKECEIDI